MAHKTLRGATLLLVAAIAAVASLAACSPRPASAARAPAPKAVAALANLVKKAELDTPTGDLAATDFSLQSMTGDTVSLSSFKGKVVLLSFWATWCGPCQQEMPAMQKLYDQLKTKGLEIVAVDIGEDKATVAAFLKKNGYTFPVLLDTTGGVAGISLYSVDAIPANFIIDKNGKIVGRKIGVDGPEWTSTERIALFEQLLAP